MKVSDIIRKVLDIIDQADTADQPIEPSIDTDTDDIRRFKQIAGLLPSTAELTVMNAPDQKYATIDAVTTLAGGGVNNPKHPSDQRVQHPSLYPADQHGVK